MFVGKKAECNVIAHCGCGSSQWPCDPVGVRTQGMWKTQVTTVYLPQVLTYQSNQKGG